MAVSFGIKADQVLKAFGVSDSDIAICKHNYAMLVGITGVKFVKDGLVVALLPMGADEFKAAQEGTLVDVSKVEAAAKLLAAIKVGHTTLAAVESKGLSKPKFTQPLATSPLKEVVSQAIAEGNKVAAKPVLISEATVVIAPSQVGVFDTSKLEISQRVKLIDAKELYQPVFGSSSGSRYFVVGIADGLVLAARWYGGKLSVRAEGSKLNSFLTKLSSMGMEKSVDYMSMHLAVADEVLAAKTIGAILVGLGLNWRSQMPIISVFANKGSGK